MAIKLPSYLHRNRHGVFGFRVVIPQHLRLLFPAREYRVSLHTTDKKQARQIALSLAGFTQDRFRKIRRMSDEEFSIPDFSFAKDLQAEKDKLSQDFMTIVNRMVARDEAEEKVKAKLEELAKMQARMDLLLDNENTPDDPVLLEEFIATRTAFNSTSQEVQSELAVLLAEEDAILDEAHKWRSRLMNIHLSTEHEKAVSAQKEGFEQERQNLADFTARAIKAAGAGQANGGMPTPSATSNELLSAVIEAYCTNQNAEGKWTEKTDAENRAIYALWLRIVGDQPIGGYEFGKHRAYIDPARFIRESRSIFYA